MSGFQVGDRVVVNFKSDYEYPRKLFNGLRGIVKIATEDESTPIGVEFDEHVDCHDIAGLGKDGYCYYLEKEDLELIENENFNSEDIQITSETTITLTILEDEYELTEEDARYILQELKKALGEGNE